MARINMAPTTEVTITIPTLEGIAAVLAVVYYATVVAHPYVVGFLLMLWSNKPERPFQIIRYAAWTFPKNCIATVRGWLQLKAAPEAYKPLSGFTTPNYYDTYAPYTPAVAGRCQLACCNPTPYSYNSPYPSSPPTYGALPSTLSPYASYTPTGTGGCQFGCCKPNPYHPLSSYSSFPTYGAVPPINPRAHGLETESEDKDGKRSGLWLVFGWGLWFCGLAVMVVYGGRAV